MEESEAKDGASEEQASKAQDRVEFSAFLQALLTEWFTKQLSWSQAKSKACKDPCKKKKKKQRKMEMQFRSKMGIKRERETE